MLCYVYKFVPQPSLIVKNEGRFQGGSKTNLVLLIAWVSKGGYALNALIVCDDVSRARKAIVGWPGSVLDNRVWTTSLMGRESDKCFASNQYILGDSAFQPSSVMILAFKKPPKVDLDIHKKFFNAQLAKVRIRTEHCIGLIKTRFQFLRGLRIKVTEKKSMKRLL
ncbi:Hypothetical protein PHPALM_19840 [Phytophthora palmivora]|uniref:DDE Tnp4 domain-containing protein n=1 Tax=Phytophthora palmivora TaxID=4796 RepID=A0A2P4XGE9_9STRA|nr:Hypothetical protein PHPALM_19840 [Phytophthora palmivora]